MKLAELQSHFQAYLVADVPEASTTKPFLSAMVDDETVGIHKRLTIYHHAYRARMEEALSTVYPNLHQWLGYDAFQQSVQAYLAQQPSSFRNLRWFGDKLADYLNQTMPEDLFAADLARFEWALSLAFDAADLPTLSIDDLAAIPPETWSALRFIWHPAVQLHRAQTHVIPAWQAIDAGETPAITTGESHYLVWRQDMMSYFKTLDAQEEMAVKFMMAGNTFGELCEALVSITGEEQAMPVAAGYLSEWLNAGMLLKDQR